MRILFFVLFSLLAGHAIAGANPPLIIQPRIPAIPAQALAAGFHNLVFDDEFTNTIFTNGGCTDNVTCNLPLPDMWYTIWPRSANSYPWVGNPDGTQHGGTVGLRAGYGAVITYSGSGTGTGFYRHCPGSQTCGYRFQFGYAEARFRWGVQTATPGMVFWLEGSPYFDGTAWAGTPGCPSAGVCNSLETFCEIDIYETFGHNAVNNSEHSWTRNLDGSLTNTFTSNHPSTAPDDPLDGNYHTLGLLWVNGTTTWYLDNVQTASISSYSICNTQPMTLILGLQGTDTQEQDIAWVRVWQ